MSGLFFPTGSVCTAQSFSDKNYYRAVVDNSKNTMYTQVMHIHTMYLYMHIYLYMYIEYTMSCICRCSFVTLQIYMYTCIYMCMCMCIHVECTVYTMYMYGLFVCDL